MPDFLYNPFSPPKKRTTEIILRFFIFCQKEKNIFVLNPVLHQIICLYHRKGIYLFIIFKDGIIAVKQILQIRKQVNPFRNLMVMIRYLYLFLCNFLFPDLIKYFSPVAAHIRHIGQVRSEERRVGKEC